MGAGQQWFYLEGTQSVGPVPEGQLVSMAGAGSVSAETLVWQDGRPNWVRLKEALPELFASPPPLPFEKPDAARVQAAADAPSPAGTRPGSETLASPSTAPQHWIDTSPHPWRRYLARMVDSSLNGAALGMLIGVVFYTIDYGGAERLFNGLADPSNRILNSVLTAFLAVPGNALLIGLTGGSVGKWLFGVRVLGPEGNPIGFAHALKREGMVLVRGLGLAIPIVTFFTLVAAFKHLNATGATSWDKEMQFTVVHRPKGALQIALSLLGVVFAVSLFVVLSAL